MRSPTALVSFSFNLVRTNIKSFAVVSAIATAAIVAAMFLLGLEPSEVENGARPKLSHAPFFLVSIIVSMVTNIVIIRIVSTPEVTIRSAYEFAMQNFFKFIWVTILVGLAILLGIVCFILPGIYLAVALSFASLIVLLENRSGSEALKRSQMYVKGNWFKVFGRYAFLIIVAIVVMIALNTILAVTQVPESSYIVSLISGFMSMLVTAFTTAYGYAMYLDLKTNAISTATAAPTPSEPSVNANNEPKTAD